MLDSRVSKSISGSKKKFRARTSRAKWHGRRIFEGGGRFGAMLRAEEK
jgi:hypothetical protein